MTKRVEPTPKPPVSPFTVKEMKSHGYGYVVFVNKNVSARVIGSVESWHRTLKDANRFAAALNKLYGRDSYKGGPI